MGAVYLAQDKRLQRPVALKVLSLDLPAEQRGGYAKQLEQEARSAARLNHPNIITIYECGFANDLPFIAMELIDGPSLKELLVKGRQFTPDKIVTVVRQLLKGLAYAHSMGVVHRDVKPANIMFTSSGVLKLTDFGIAHLIAGDWTHTNALSGSPVYMSPEQVRCAPLDGRSDLFSVGVVMYELLTGRLPFASDNMASIVYQIMFETPPAPVELNPDTPRWLSDVVMTCLQKDPQQRYADAESCIQALRVAGRESAATAVPKRTPTAKTPAGAGSWLQRQRRPLLLLSLLSGLGMIVWRNLHPPPASPALPAARQTVARPAAGVAPAALPAKAAVPDAPAASLPVSAPPSPMEQAALDAPPMAGAAEPAKKKKADNKPAKRRDSAVAAVPAPTAARSEPAPVAEPVKAEKASPPPRKHRDLPSSAGGGHGTEANADNGKGKDKSDAKQKGFWQQQADCLLRNDCDPAQLKRPRIR